MKVRRALVSVSDKKNLEELVRTLHELGAEILSTGGTSKKIKEWGVPVKDVSEHTGFPEMMDGRVKTLHPKIHGGLLALRDNKDHMEQAGKNGIGMIDMVVVNLYPFEKTVAKEGVALEEAIENIDIGGPSMLRSAAKNYRSVAVITDPDKYADIVKELKETKGSLSEKTLERLAVDVFRRTSAYDTAIRDYLEKRLGPGKAEEGLPDALDLRFEKAQALRYGENPHQTAAFYREKDLSESGIVSARQLQGKELSFNNILDLNAAIEIVKEFDEPAASVIKHTNPCGAAAGKDLAAAYLDALDSDRLSAFGSIVGFNGRVGKDLAEAILR
ncbi:MAG: bifunctional phosphoribosylaminoimidazolecarboxamide formyltransferase/IMP cyclohydrolase, partial [Candidatus Omnitrophota bacterium]